MKDNKLPRHTDEIIDKINRDLGIGKFSENDFGLTKQEVRWLNAALKGINGEEPKNLFSAQEQKILKKVERQERKKQLAYEQQEMLFHTGVAKIEGNVSAFFLKVVHNIIPDTDMKEINRRFHENHGLYMVATKGSYREHLLARAKENADFNDRQAAPSWYGFGAVDHRSVWELDCNKAEDILAPGMQENDYGLFWNLCAEDDHPERVRERTFGRDTQQTKEDYTVVRRQKMRVA